VTESRRVVLVLIAVAVVLAVLPVLVARSHRVQSMRADLSQVMGECRDRYAGARSTADSAAADAWQPPLHGAQRPGDPSCGAYRRRNMLGDAR
jgi:hypothetical protein